MINGMDKIPVMKVQILKTLCLSEAFRGLMSNGKHPSISAQQLLSGYVMPWEFVPGAAAEEASFVGCEVEVQRAGGGITSTYATEIYVMTHRSLLRMPGQEAESRIDKLAVEINRLLNGGEGAGLGRMELSATAHYTPAENFYGRRLSFTTQGFNRFGESL